METTKFIVQVPFDIHYDPQSRSLTLTHDETLMGHRPLEIWFDPEATRTLYEALALFASHSGGIIGAPSQPRPGQ